MIEGEDVSSKVFIGGLAAVTTNETLQAYFANYYPLECLVMIDKLTGRSRGFGFVTFASHEVSNGVLMLPHVIDGKSVECKACVSRSDARDSGMVPAPRFGGHGGGYQGGGGGGFAGGAPGGPRFGGPPPGGRPVENKVFVGGLAPVTTSESMNAYFSQFGNADCIVMMDRQTGRSRGFGFCTFESAEQVQLALMSGSNATGKTAEHAIDGKLVCARLCEDRGERGPPQRAAFQPQYGGGGVGAGEDPNASLSSALASLQQAIGSLTGAAGGDQQSMVQHEAGGFAPSRVFVGGLPQTCDDAKLHMFFSQWGTLTDAKVMMDKGTQRSRGFGYVSYADPQACELVLASGRQHIDDKPIEIRRCEERGSASLHGRALAPPPQHLQAAAFQSHMAPAEDPLTAALALLQPQQQVATPQLDPNTIAQLMAAAAGQTGAAPGAPDILGQMTQMLQDPQMLLQAILSPLASQLGGVQQQQAPGMAYQQPDNNRYAPY